MNATITLKVPAVKTFDVPEGEFRGTLKQIRPKEKQTKRGPQKWIRLVFELSIPNQINQVPCAGRNFLLDLNPGSDLRNFLEVWLGDDFFDRLSNQEFDFATLLNKEGIVCLSHWFKEVYNKPHVHIDCVRSLDQSDAVLNTGLGS